MDTLSELKKYCLEENTFGALLLTGQWGCGKTYLIDHQLCEDKELQRQCLFIKMSLFGVDSVDSINREVKLSYLSQKWIPQNEAAQKGLSKIKAFYNFVQSAGVIPEALDKIAGAVLSSEISNFIEIESEVIIKQQDETDARKKVILIFDDFERCKIDIFDLMGCINSYCESKSIKVIIVANEEFLKKKEDKKEVSNDCYDVIKEKLIARTLLYYPQYDSIVKSIIANYRDESYKYKRFLEENQNQIVDLFCTLELKNLRSLKCGLQDFQRIYEVYLSSEYVSKASEDLMRFLSATMQIKSGEKQEKINEDTIRFMATRDWLLEGLWDEEKLKAEIEEQKRREVPMPPKDKLKMLYLLDMSEEDIKNGFEQLLNEAYEGILTLNEYDVLIQNLSFARKIQYDFPVKVDYGELEKGLKKCIHKLNQEDDPSQRVLMTVEVVNDTDELLEPERRLCQIIWDYRKKDTQMFESNKRNYINALADGDDTLFKHVSKRYKAFDKDIADAVFTHYIELPQCYRRNFTNNFFSMWKTCLAGMDISIEDSIKGLEYLLEQIKSKVFSSTLEKYIDTSFEKYVQELVSIIHEKEKDDKNFAEV